MPPQADDSAFPPLLKRIEQASTLWGREGKLSLEISAFGDVDATFLYHDFHPDDVVNPRQAGYRDADLTLADGRTVRFARCGVPLRTATLGEPGSKWELLPLETTVRTPTVNRSRAEFGLVDLWLHLDGPPLSFGGHEFDLRADLTGHHGYRDLGKGDRAPVMYWAATDLTPADDVSRVWQVAHCLADTLSMLLHQRVGLPCYRITDGAGALAEFHFQLQSRWPTVSDHLLYTANKRAAIEAVGRADVCREFAELELDRYVGYVLEALRHDLPVELGLASALIALESLSSRWLLARGCCRAEALRTMNIVGKLSAMNKSEVFRIDSRYLGDWLRDVLRNNLMHSGRVPNESTLQIADDTNELVILATDIFFGLFGFVRETASR